jgi:hypothetical protein
MASSTSGCRITRRNRALLVIAIKRGEIDLRDWSVTDLTKLLSASPRSVSEASKLSFQERQDIADGQRPLFPQHSSVAAPF